MIDKVVASVEEAVADLPDGAVVLVGGFGEVGVPRRLIDAVVARGARKLTLVSNNCGTQDDGVGALFKHGCVRKACVSFPVQRGADYFRAAYDRGEVELELIPQGTLAERLRAAGAGLGGFLTPTGVGTVVAQGKTVVDLDGRSYLLERPLRGDFALVRAHQADRHGNVRFRLAARNFNPIMAMAAAVTVVEVEEIVPLGTLQPDDIHTPGIFVDRVVAVGREA